VLSQPRRRQERRTASCSGRAGTTHASSALQAAFASKKAAPTAPKHEGPSESRTASCSTAGQRVVELWATWSGRGPGLG
jgi:hypothetical protein